MKFLITGCARSGTVFTTELFKQAGIACDHERVFNVETRLDRWEDGGEVSWEAAPHVPQVLAMGIPVMHQVRHPLRVIASLIHYKLFSDITTEPWRHYIYQHCPQVEQGDELEQATRYWLYWNQMCHLPGVIRHRVEDIEPAGLSTTTNTRGPTPRLAWTDLPLRPEVTAQAAQYGY